MSRLHKVDSTEIQSTKTFSVKERNELGEPIVLVRFSDNSKWEVGDFVTNGTKMRGNITGFEFYISEGKSEIQCFVNHTWSGVGMGLENLILVPNILPTQFQVKQVVDFVLNDTHHTATVNAIHFTESKVRYDLDVWLMKDGGNSSTRIYNVDSVLVMEKL